MSAPTDTPLDPREQEMLTYLEDLQANNPAEYEMLVQQLQEQAAAKGGGGGSAAESQQKGEQVTPTPGFVAKTRSFTRKGAKVFINVCSSEHVDKPAPVEGADNAEEVQMRIPMSLGPPREDLDKTGEVCMVYDVVFHPDAVEASLKEEEFRSFVMQLSVHQIQQKHQDELSTQMTFPKIKGNYKGIAPLPQFMRKKGVPPPPPPGAEPAEGAAADATAAASSSSGAGADGKPTLVEEVEAPPAEVLPAPCYAVEPRRVGSGEGEPDALSLKCHLPDVDDADAIQLDVSVEQVELLVPGVCALSVALPRLVALPPVSCRFERERRILSLLLRADVANTLDQGVGGLPEAAATSAASGGEAAGGGGGASPDSEEARREREREARLNARRRRAAGNKQLAKQAAAAEAAAQAEAAAADVAATGDGAGGGSVEVEEADRAAAEAAEEEEKAAAERATAEKAAAAEKAASGWLELTNSIIFELEE
jgi:hypothetical protein